MKTSNAMHNCNLQNMLFNIDLDITILHTVHILFLKENYAVT